MNFNFTCQHFILKPTQIFVVFLPTLHLVSLKIISLLFISFTLMELPYIIIFTISNMLFISFKIALHFFLCVLDFNHCFLSLTIYLCNYFSKWDLNISLILIFCLSFSYKQFFFIQSLFLFIILPNIKFHTFY